MNMKMKAAAVAAAGCRPPVRAPEQPRGAHFLVARGYTDALSEFDRRSPTWRWRWRWRWGIVRLSRRFDHVMYSAGLHACRAAVVKAGASDHFPVVAVFDRRAEPQPPGVHRRGTEATEVR